MPCRDYGAEDEWRHRQDRERETAMREARKTIDQMTRMLCSLCRAAEDNVEFPHNVKKWWEKHQAADAVREEKARKAADAAKRRKAAAKRKEVVANAALAKLNKEERKALGLK